MAPSQPCPQKYPVKVGGKTLIYFLSLHTTWTLFAPFGYCQVGRCYGRDSEIDSLHELVGRKPHLIHNIESISPNADSLALANWHVSGGLKGEPPTGILYTVLHLPGDQPEVSLIWSYYTSSTSGRASSLSVAPIAYMHLSLSEIWARSNYFYYWAKWHDKPQIRRYWIYSMH